MSLYELYCECFYQLLFSFKMQIESTSFAVTFPQEKILACLSCFPSFSVKKPIKIQQTCLNPALKGKDLISDLV